MLPSSANPASLDSFAAVPVIDVSSLRQGDAASGRAAADAAIGVACRNVGFFVVTGAADDDRALAELRRQLLRFFELPAAEKRKLARRKYVPENPNRYRGYFHPLDGMPSYKEGIDLGLDRPVPVAAVADGDILREPNVWPPESALPGWRAAMGAYGSAMERVGFLLLRAIARHLRLAEDWFDPLFRDGASTLRLLKYPPRPAASYAGAADLALCEHDGAARPVITGAHTDSGCLTLLWQDSIGGLQVRNAAGRWIDVPTMLDAIVVNLGDLMQCWTGGAFAATAHRVLGGSLDSRTTRYSIPFFFEPSLDASIRPIPGLLADPELEGTSVRYGDYLRGKIEHFTEYRDFARN